MGGENSAPAKSIPEKTRVPDPIRPNYQPPVRSYANVTNTAPIGRNPTALERSIPPQYYQSQPSVHQPKQPTLTAPVQQPLPVVNKERLASVSIEQQPPPAPVQITSASQNNSLPFTCIASDFQKAPPVQLNYVVRSSNNQSVRTYEPDDIMVMRRTSLQAVAQGNRWYDVDYNQNTRPHIVKYI